MPHCQCLAYFHVLSFLLHLRIGSNNGKLDELACRILVIRLSVELFHYDHYTAHQGEHEDKSNHRIEFRLRFLWVHRNCRRCKNPECRRSQLEVLFPELGIIQGFQVGKEILLGKVYFPLLPFDGCPDRGEALDFLVHFILVGKENIQFSICL